MFRADGTLSQTAALVIGNGAYPGSGRLDNPVNDANAISQKLSSMGFTVTTVTDANRQRLVQSMAQFRRTAAAADISLLFYAGHGVQIFGTNYILPTDVDQTDPAQATIQGVSLNSVVENFLPGKTKLVFLDACRDNPFRVATRAARSRGLAPTSAATGQMIIFSAGTGQQALDKLGNNDTERNGLFTRLLLREMKKPGLSIDRIVRSVRTEVARLAKTVGHEQTPAVYDQTLGDFYFIPVAANSR